MSNYIGIDLGTTESTISVIDINRRNENPVDKLRSIPIYQIDEHFKFNRDIEVLQSAIYVDRVKKKIFTGDWAKKIYSSGTRPLHTIRSIKTRIGGESMIQVPFGDNLQELASYNMTELSAVL